MSFPPTPTQPSTERLAEVATGIAHPMERSSAPTRVGTGTTWEWGLALPLPKCQGHRIRRQCSGGTSRLTMMSGVARSEAGERLRTRSSAFGSPRSVMRLESSMVSNELSRRAGPSLHLFSVLMLALSLSGCGTYSDGCDGYRDLLQDPVKRDALVAWADSSVFNRAFSATDEERKSFRGYGPKSMNIRPDSVKPPSEAMLATATVQVRGEDLSRPDFVFVGARPFRGVIVSRSSFMERWGTLSRNMEGIEVVSDRVAMECRPPLK